MDEKIIHLCIYYTQASENPWMAFARAEDITLDGGGYFWGEGRTKLEALNDLVYQLEAVGLA
jgi:hypothetical protein